MVDESVRAARSTGILVEPRHRDATGRQGAGGRAGRHAAAARLTACVRLGARQRLGWVAVVVEDVDRGVGRGPVRASVLVAGGRARVAESVSLKSKRPS